MHFRLISLTHAVLVLLVCSRVVVTLGLRIHFRSLWLSVSGTGPGADVSLPGDFSETVIIQEYVCLSIRSNYKCY